MLETILAAIASIGAIVTGIVWLVKRFTPTLEQTHEDIDKKVNQQKDAVKAGDRPQW